MFKWLVKQFWSLSLGLEPLAVEFAGEPAADAIDFGHLPQLANLSRRMLTAWINPADVASTSQIDVIAGFFSDEAAFALYWNDNDARVHFIQKYSGSGGGQGIWATPIGSVPSGARTLVCVVKDLSSDNPPVIYVNNVVQTLTVIVAPPAGRTAFAEDGVPWMIGNVKTATVDYAYGFGGTITDVRLYESDQSSQIDALYNGGVPDVSAATDGLLFQGPCVRTKDYPLYEDATLTESLRVLDNMFGMVGTPHGSPIGRAV